MKKTFWSLAVLMLMAAPVMTSCSNDLDEVAPVEEVKSNVVTITIAPPVAEAETRVAMDGLKITGWTVGDEVTLYKATQGTPGDWVTVFDREYPTITTPGVTFTCTNASTGEFSSTTMPDGESIDNYALAVYGGVASFVWDMAIQISPTTWYSEDIEDVVTMVAWKDSEGKFTMKVLNNVLKIKNTTASDVVVAWYGDWANHKFYQGMTTWGYTILDEYTDPHFDWAGTTSNDCIWDWGNVAHMTLKAGKVTYLNFPMVTENDIIGLKKENGDAVVTPKNIGAKATTPGHLFNVGEYSGAAL